MLDKSRRKELLQQYADRAPPNGVFAVRNSATGEVWVGHSRNLDKQKNGLWVRLKGNSCTSREMQASWTKHGEAAFSYEILEQLTETDPHAIQRLLPERAAAWREQLNAGLIKGT
jgi:hypothetical protein